MPPSCYSKALREPIYFLWDCRERGTKATRAQYRSRSAIETLESENGRVVQDHAIPFGYQQADLLKLRNVTAERVHKVLRKYEVRVLVTIAEDRLLTAKGLRSKMPDAWNRIDPLPATRLLASNWSRTARSKTSDSQRISGVHFPEQKKPN